MKSEVFSDSCLKHVALFYGGNKAKPGVVAKPVIPAAWKCENRNDRYETGLGDLDKQVSRRGKVHLRWCPVLCEAKNIKGKRKGEKGKRREEEKGKGGENERKEGRLREIYIYIHNDLEKQIRNDFIGQRK